MTNLLLTEVEKIRLQEEYGKRSWSADTLANISSWPRRPGKAAWIVGKSYIENTGDWGQGFVRAFEEATNWSQHQMETTAFRHAQKAKGYDPTDAFTAYVIRKHKDDPNIEVTVSGHLISHNNVNYYNSEKDNVFYQFSIGLNYGGNDEQFVPEEAPSLSLAEQLKYKITGRSPDARLREDKFPLIKRQYDGECGARVVCSGFTDERKVPEVRVEVKDKRLKKVASELSDLVSKYMEK